jgi:hypothetical protein
VIERILKIDIVDEADAQILAKKTVDGTSTTGASKLITKYAHLQGEE